MEQYREDCCKGCSTVVFDNTLQGNQEIFSFGEFYIIIKEGKTPIAKLFTIWNSTGFHFWCCYLLSV